MVTWLVCFHVPVMYTFKLGMSYELAVRMLWFYQELI